MMRRSVGRNRHQSGESGWRTFTVVKNSFDFAVGVRSIRTRFWSKHCMSRRSLFAFIAIFLLVTRALALPRIDSFTPAVGAPGTQITILGSELDGITQVFFGTAKGNILSRASFGLVVVVPLDATSAPIYVYDQKGQFDYTFTAFQVAPRISSVTPGHGVLGDEVVIDGYNLSNLNNQDLLPLVFFNNAQAVVYVASDTQLRATVPSAATTGPITVVTLGGNTKTATPFYLPPVIASFLPEAAQAGEVITLKGVNFTGAKTVQIGGANATIVNAQLSELTAIVPVGVLDGPIYIETPGGAFFTDVSKPFKLRPKIESFSPVGGDVGASVRIDGSGLRTASQVFFGETASPVVDKGALFATTTVPKGALTGPLTVVTANGTNQSLSVFYVAPTVTSILPIRGPVGTVVTIRGVNFTGTTKVEFGGISASQVVVRSKSEIQATVPGNALSGVIRVTNPGGQASSGTPFEVVGDEPNIGSFTPEFGSPGALITLTGFNFAGATNVTFGGVSSVPTVQSDTRLVVVVPAGAVTGRLKVFSPKGSGESATDFVVGDNAELRLTLNSLPNPPIVGARLVYTIDVRNNGPLDATGVVINFAIPKEADYVNATVSRGSFEKLGTGVINTVGRLNSGASATLLVMVKPKAEGLVTAAAQVTADTPDANTQNNAAKLILSAVPVTLKLDAIGNGFVRVVWPDVATNYVLQATSSMRPPVWTDVTNAVFHIEEEFRVAVPFESGANQFFRLMQP